MTVCIAAICEGNFIIGSADRMLTARDVEFEPRESPFPGKILPITTAVVAMTAGDSGLQAEVITRIYRIVNSKIAAAPTTWIKVREVVDLYVDAYNNERQRRIESLVLSPYNLTLDSFRAQQKEMAEAFVQRVSEEISGYIMPEVETIIAGIDTDSGAHIYSLWGPEVTCCDLTGFAAIGIGARHAAFQFMLAGHNRFLPLPDTLLLTYIAKKKAEVAPGVGRETDMFSVGPNVGSFQWLRDLFKVADLNKIYEKFEAKNSVALRIANQSAKKYVAKILAKKAAAQQQKPPENPPSAPPPAFPSPPNPPPNPA